MRIIPTITPLRARREALGLDHKAVAAAVGISIRTLYRLEEKNRLPKTTGLRAPYAAALGLTTDALAALVAPVGRNRAANKRRTMRTAFPQRTASPQRKAAVRS
jgi:transcriptional regulator with XRE-family HTH domain